MVNFPQCLDCKNFIDKNEKGVFICKAFPDGIPDDVFWNNIWHDEHIDGDNGYRFEDKYKK